MLIFNYPLDIILTFNWIHSTHSCHSFFPTNKFPIIKKISFTNFNKRYLFNNWELISWKKRMTTMCPCCCWTCFWYVNPMCQCLYEFFPFWHASAPVRPFQCLFPLHGKGHIPLHWWWFWKFQTLTQNHLGWRWGNLLQWCLHPRPPKQGPIQFFPLYWVCNQAPVRHRAMWYRRWKFFDLSCCSFCHFTPFWGRLIGLHYKVRHSFFLFYPKCFVIYAV